MADATNAEKGVVSAQPRISLASELPPRLPPQKDSDSTQ
jgi:hypothetical protein